MFYSGKKDKPCYEAGFFFSTLVDAALNGIAWDQGHRRQELPTDLNPLPNSRGSVIYQIQWMI